MAEMPYAMAKDGSFPKLFAKENEEGSPSSSLWVTSGLMQLAILMVYFASNAWNTMLSITAVMVLPAYLVSCMFLWKISEDKQLQNSAGVSRTMALITGILGTVYAIWLIYAAGLSYLFMAVIFIALGIPFYIWARKDAGVKGDVFNSKELILAGILVLIAIGAIIAFYAGYIKI